MGDRRPRGAGASVEDAAGDDRRATRRHGGVAKGAAGTDGGETEAGRTRTEGDAGTIAGGEARERTAVAGELGERVSHNASVYLSRRETLFNICEIGLRPPPIGWKGASGILRKTYCGSSRYQGFHLAIRNHQVQRHFVRAGGLGTTVAAGIISAMNISACSRDTASAALREFFVGDD